MSSPEFSVDFLDGSDDHFNGIVAHIRDLVDGNPLKKNAINIISPTETHPEYPLSNLVEYTDMLDKCFWNFACYDPKDNENWLIFDFGLKRRVQINAYSLRSGGSSHPKSWAIQGANLSGETEETTTSPAEIKDWKTYHEIKECKLLNGPRKTETFRVENPEENEPVRFVRYLQIENQSPRPERKYRINLKAIEFFGKCFYVDDK